MLTKNEAQALYNCLVGLDLRPDEIKERIESFTEGKRKIQSGDIYKDNQGKYETVGFVNLDGNYFRTEQAAYRYDLSGNYLHPDCRGKEFSLDLSHRYKLFEVDDDDKLINLKQEGK